MSNKAIKNEMMKGTALAAMSIGLPERFETTNRLSRMVELQDRLPSSEPELHQSGLGSTPKASIAGNKDRSQDDDCKTGVCP